MHVANLEPCTELYEVSGWVEEYSDWYGHNKDYDAPKYTLGYLLRKLPKFYEEGKTVYLLTVQPNPIGAGWQAQYRFASRTPNSAKTASKFRQEADTPEDCAAKLCIALFEQGILTKEIEAL